MLDWLILGGGVHGTCISHALRQRAGVPEHRLRVVDPEATPLANFWRVTAATGMQYLRSSSVHHIDTDPYSLRRFGRRAGRKVARFVPPYDRPGLAFFRAHVEHVVQTYRLDALRLQARAERVSRRGPGFEVETTEGVLRARQLVLALGLGEQCHWPAWAEPHRGHAHIRHMFEPSFERHALAESAERVVIVGGGISAVQLALTLTAPPTRARHVTLVVRHAPRVARFDSDPEWLGPLAMTEYRKLSAEARRDAIRRARNRGSLPPELAQHLAHAIERRLLRWVVDEVASLEVDEASVRMRTAAGALLDANALVLATGFDAHRPGGTLLDDAALDRLGLATSPCGYPSVSPQLAWAPGLYVTGPLAELELGPTARNIAGARAASERVVAAARVASSHKVFSSAKSALCA
jgi:cation diffusion facilitator CzcD-associated flavoprotein CzcO